MYSQWNIQVVTVSRELWVSPVEYKAMAFRFEVRSLCKNEHLFYDNMVIYFPFINDLSL